MAQAEHAHSITGSRALAGPRDSKALCRVFGIPDITCGQPMPFPFAELFGEDVTIVDFSELDARIERAIDNLIALRDALDDTDGDLDFEDQNASCRWHETFRSKHGGGRHRPGSESENEESCEADDEREDDDPAEEDDESGGNAEDLGELPCGWLEWSTP